MRQPPSPGAARLRRPIILMLAGSAGLVVVAALGAALGSGRAGLGPWRSGRPSVAQAPLAALPADSGTRSAADATPDPAGGCPTPAVSIDEAREAVAGEAGFHGEVTAPFELVWSQYMSWDAYAWAFEAGSGYPEPGCVWALELRGMLLFNDFPPPLSRDATPPVEEMNFIQAAVDGATGHVVHTSMGWRDGTPGTPQSLRPPPVGGYPTVEPIDLERLAPDLPVGPIATPAPPWFTPEPGASPGAHRYTPPRLRVSPDATPTP